MEQHLIDFRTGPDFVKFKQKRYGFNASLNVIRFLAKHAWPFEPPQCMKMMRRSPDERLCPLSRFSQLSPEERLRIAADCLSRLRGQRPDPKPIPHESYNLGEKYPNPIFEDGPGPGLEPVGGEF